jgi:hypothetical protein
MAAAAPRRRGDDRRLLDALARAAKSAWVEQPPTGAHWARSAGCGTTIEGKEDGGAMIACGMGFVPELGRRFLLFWNEDK